MFKKIFYLLAFFLLLIPFSCKAENSLYEITSYNHNFTDGHFEFTDFEYYDNDSGFGLQGSIFNNSLYPDFVYLDIAFYDKDTNLIISDYCRFNLDAAATQKFNCNFNPNDLKDKTTKDIFYFSYTVNFNVTSTKPLLNIPSQLDQYKNREYVIDNYDVNIVVNENNTLDITENITAYFNVPKHGIIRNIPLKNTIKRNDGSTSSNRAQISNVAVNTEHTISHEGGEYQIKLGSSNTTLTGSKKYVIKYTYNLGPDPLKNIDEFYFNIIGPSWDTVIGGINFEIVMPKAFDKTKLGFSSGNYGALDNDKIEYSVNENTITGTYNGILNSHNALTMRLELEEGYFVGAKLNVSPYTALMFIIPTICTLGALLIWFKFGKDKMVVETVEFYPPDNLNSLDIAYLYKGNVDNKDVISLLIYLASKGYLKIEENLVDLEQKKIPLSAQKKEQINKKIKDLKEKIANLEKTDPTSKKIPILKNSLINYQNFDQPINTELNEEEKKALKNNIKETKDAKIVFTKLKEYDQDNACEEIFFNGIFPDKNSPTRTLKTLKNEFYSKISRITNLVQNKYKDKVFEKRNIFLNALLVILLYLVLFTAFAIPLNAFANPSSLVILLVLLGFFTPFLCVAFIEEAPVSFRIMWCSFSSFCILCLFGGFLSSMGVVFEPIYIGGIIYGILGDVVILLCLINIKKRTDYGNQMLGRIRGFKTFLETVEKEKLVSLASSNPTYFYDILPYAYVLDISDVWINKFEDLAVPEVDWYNGSSNIHQMSSFVGTTMRSINWTMSYSPSSSSSSGGSSSSSSGGGSSGGGSGGGGGSSW